MAALMLKVITRLKGESGDYVIGVTRALEDEWPALVVAGGPSSSGDAPDGPALGVQRLDLGSGLSPLKGARAVQRLCRLVAREGPWLVETHGFKSGALGRLVASRSRPRPRTVHTYHGRGRLEIPRGVPVPVFREAERKMARHTDLLVATSAEIRDQMFDLGVGREAQWRTVPTAHEPAPPRLPGGLEGRLRSELGIPENVCLAGTFARLAPALDHATLMEAMRLTPGLHLVIGGAGGSRADLERRLSAAGLGGRVHLAGWWADLPGSMAEVDLVVLASRVPPDSTALMEAARSGRPVVATSTSGAADVVRHNVTGLLVRNGEPSDLAGAMRQLQVDTRRRAAMGLEARKLATRSAIAQTLDALCAVYAELDDATPR